MPGVQKMWKHRDVFLRLNFLYQVWLALSLSVLLLSSSSFVVVVAATVAHSLSGCTQASHLCVANPATRPLSRSYARLSKQIASKNVVRL